MNKLRILKASLSDTQNALMKPALSCLQVGVGFYLIDVIKPFIVPLMFVSLGTIAVILFQAISETSSNPIVVKVDVGNLDGCK